MDSTVSSGEETIEAFNGSFAIPGACGFEMDDETVGLEATDEDNRFLSAEGWIFVGIEVLQVWVGMGGLADCITILVVVDSAFSTGEAVGECLAPEYQFQQPRDITERTRVAPVPTA